MASPLFTDITFPSELYTPTGDFTAPIQDLLHFAPRVVAEVLGGEYVKKYQSQSQLQRIHETPRPSSSPASSA
ncbi:hypothetical protein HK102_009431, partial [Quaeritorhiza haematococci]